MFWDSFFQFFFAVHFNCVVHSIKSRFNHDVFLLISQKKTQKKYRKKRNGIDWTSTVVACCWFWFLFYLVGRPPDGVGGHGWGSYRVFTGFYRVSVGRRLSERERERERERDGEVTVRVARGGNSPRPWTQRHQPTRQQCRKTSPKPDFHTTKNAPPTVKKNQSNPVKPNKTQ